MKHIIEKTTIDDLLIIMRKYGLKLRDIKEETPEICSETINQHSCALEYVREQTTEICLEAKTVMFYNMSKIKLQNYVIMLINKTGIQKYFL